jgi:hypothetical protein
MPQAQSAVTTCWDVELAGTLYGMYTPLGYVYPRGLYAVNPYWQKGTAASCPTGRCFSIQGDKGLFEEGRKSKSLL